MRFAARLHLSFLFVGLLSIALLGFIFLSLFNRRIDEEIDLRLDRGRDTVVNQIGAVKEKAVIQGEALKGHQEIIGTLRERGTRRYLRDIAQVKAKTDLDILEIIGRDGVSELSFTQSVSFGKDRSRDPLFRLALEGSVAAGLVFSEEFGIYILAAVPVRENGQLLGVLQTGYFFDERLLSEIKRWTKIDLTLYQPEGITTTLLDPRGHYYSADRDFREEFNFAGGTYRNIYFDLLESFEFLGPVTTTEGLSPEEKVLATLMVSLPIDDALAAKAATLRIFFIYILAVALAAIAFSYVISKTVTKQLSDLSLVVGKVSKGDFSVAAREDSKDEFGLLAKAFNQMVAELKSAFAQLEKDSRLLLRRDFDLVMLTQELDKRNLELKNTVATLKAANEKSGILLGSIGDGVMAIDGEGRVILFNQALSTLTGFKPRDVLNKKFDSFLKLKEETGAAITFSYLQQRIKKERASLYFRDAVLLHGKGRKTFVYLAVTPIESPLEELRGFMVVFHNVSREKELERMKLDFVSMAVHELRNPISIIRGHLSFLQESTHKFSLEEQEFLNRAMVGATNLNDLVENLLSVSQIEQGKLEVKLRPVPIEETVARVLDEFKQLAKSKGLKLIYKPPTRPLPEVLADVFRIEVVLRNLLNNAIGYTQKGEVEVTVEKQGDFVVTAVRDTGQGIPAEAMPHLFTKFFRVQGELQSGSKGTGLGLYISKRIVATHKGKIWAESQLDVGTTVSFSLPIAA